ncbi:MAG: ABC transporter substrate-binding protein, partial [Saccharolobus sp.]
GDLAWVNISTLQQIYENLPFLTNQTQQTLEVAKVYQILYQEAPYAWLPNPVVYYFVQPYVKGFVYNPFIGYYYNLMYYQPYTVTISTSTSITSTTTTNFVTTSTSTVTTTPTQVTSTATTTSSSSSTLLYATIGIVVVIVIIVVAIVLLRGRGRGGPGF